MKSAFPRLAFSFLLVSLLAVLSQQAWGQYTAVNLVSNTNIYNPVNMDPNLINSWGLAALRSSPFWVSAQNTSSSPLYTANGTIVPLLVEIPCVTNFTTGATSIPCQIPGLFEPNNGEFNLFGPSGIVANDFFRSGAFRIPGSNAPALFIFSTLDGLIVGWSPTVNQTQGVVAVNFSATGVGYNGLAIAGPADNPHLYAANATTGEIDVFDKNFNLVNSFAADSNASFPFLPYGITAIGRKLYVTYFSVAESAGILDVCNLSDNDNDVDDGINPPCRRLFASIPSSSDASAPVLASPWGIALAPHNFGPLSGKLLVGNVDDGLIHAFDPESGSLIGTLNLADGTPFAVPGLWGLAFGRGNSANGPVNHLFFSAGPSAILPNVSDAPQQYGAGLFGVIKPPNQNDGDNGSQ